MAKTVDVYMPLDARAEPNREVWPIAKQQLGELVRVIEKCGWKANVLNPEGPVSSVAQGIRTVRDARGDRFLNFIAGWAYPDFSVSPIYGAVGPRSMQMWNKISEADFLRVFGIAREGFDGLRLVKMAEKVPARRAEDALAFLVEKGMDVRLGTDPVKHLTREMVLFQMKVYFALLELKKQFGLDFIGVQDQLDWIEHYPATDLTLGLLNNKLRPESDGTTLMAATEADDGAALTMQVLMLLSGGEPVGFNVLRDWDPREGLYWFVNSGALAPYFAEGRHDSLRGSWSERQTYMYFREGGGTSSVVVRVPGVVTWARFSYRNNQMYLCAGRGVTDVPTEQQWRERSAKCSPDWPHWYLKLCGRVEEQLNTNHPMTVCGDYLAELKALAGEVGIPFECYDYRSPDEIQRGAKL